MKREEERQERGRRHVAGLIEATEKAYAYRGLPNLAASWEGIRDTRAALLLALVAEALSKGD